MDISLSINVKSHQPLTINVTQPYHIILKKTIENHVSHTGIMFHANHKMASSNHLRNPCQAQSNVSQPNQSTYDHLKLETLIRWYWIRAFVSHLNGMTRSNFLCTQSLKKNDKKEKNVYENLTGQRRAFSRPTLERDENKAELLLVLLGGRIR